MPVQNEGQPKSKCELVVSSMLDLLASGEYAPGERLPPEAYFMNRFDASRNTIRESFKQLSMMGLIEIKRGDGTYVSEAKLSSLAYSLLPCIVLNKDNVDELFEARKTIEVSIAELACRKRLPEEIDAMRRCITNMSVCVDSADMKYYTELDNLFHNQIANACHNPLLISIYELFSEVREKCMENSNDSPISLKRSYLAHRNIFNAIEQREDKYIGFLMVMHLNYSQSASNRIFGPAQNRDVQSEPLHTDADPEQYYF